MQNIIKKMNELIQNGETQPVYKMLNDFNLNQMNYLLSDHFFLTNSVMESFVRDYFVSTQFFKHKVYKNYKDKATGNILVEACVNRPGIVSYLLDGGADVNTSNIQGMTPLMTACKCQPSLVPELLKAGANPFATKNDSPQRTALFYLSSSRLDTPDGKIALLALLKAGIDINSQDRGKKNLLSYNLNNLNNCQFLIDLGIDINLKSENNSTVLMQAAQHYPDIIPFLLAKGAEIDVVDSFGRTALKQAQQFGVTASIQHLNNHLVKQFIDEKAVEKKLKPRSSKPHL